MKTYKARVTDPTDNRRFYIEGEYESKKEFMNDIYGNGYTCSNYLCKEKKVFDWIIEQLDCVCDSEGYYAIMHFMKIPKDNREYSEMMEKYRNAYWKNKAHQFAYRERKKYR